MATPITPEYLARSGTEHGEQAAVFCWAAQNRTEFPELRWLHAIPNGGGRSMAQGAALKAEGVKGGVADVCLPVVRPGRGNTQFVGLYIEMKKRDGVPSNVSAEQLDFGAFVLAQSYAWVPCFGWQQATRLIQSYLRAELYVHSEHQQTVLKKAWELSRATYTEICPTSH